MPDRVTPNQLTLWVIYRQPRDFPNNYVLRAHDVNVGTRTVVPRGEAQVVSSLHAARRHVPAGCTNIGRYEQDDPCIAEVWV